jgi:hypothetical protein
MKFPKKISEIFRNFRKRKFVKIYENFPMGNFQRPGYIFTYFRPQGRKFLKIDPGEIIQQGLNAYTAVSQSNA